MNSPRKAWRQGRAITAWVLVVGLWLQPLLTYLTTPWFDEDASGHVVFMCTLNGLKQVRVENRLLDLDTENAEKAYPAPTLVQLAETARIAMPLAIPSARLFTVDRVEINRTKRLRTRHTSFYSSRAPPLA